MTAPLLDVKVGAYELLGQAFADYTGGERVDVFYGWKDVRTRNRFIVVGGGQVRYEDTRLATGLSQYDQIATLTIAACCGLDQYDEMTAERNCHALMEVAKTALLADGGEAWNGRVGGIFDVSPTTEDYSVRIGQERQPQWSVLELAVDVAIVRS